MNMLIEIELAKKEINEIELNNFMMICGSPRSGTTFLFDCIMNNNKLKANKCYQTFFPGTKLMKKEIKIKLAGEFFKQTLKDNVYKQHRIDLLNKPEESLVSQNWLGMTFSSIMKEVRLSQLRRDCLNMDLTLLFEVYKNVKKLFYLENEVKEDEIYCMKHTFILMHLNKYLEQFPKAKVIFIHRNPIQVYKSNFLLHDEYSCSTEFNYDWYSHNLLDMLVSQQKRGIYYREELEKKNPEIKKQFYDVSYHELITNPLKVCEDIFKYFNIEFNEESKNKLKQFLNDDQHVSFSKSKEIKECTISDEEIKEAFKFYKEKYGKYIPDWE